MKKQRRLILLAALPVVLILALSACQPHSLPASQAAPVISSTSQPAVVQPTATLASPTAAPTPTSTTTPPATESPPPTATPPPTPTPTPPHSLSIAYLRQQAYPGGEIIIEEQLGDGGNYSRYIASYQSEGLKINGLLTIPFGEAPETGWPVIVFNHGYIPPDVYRTTERYVNYVDGFASSGYIVFRSDYRGHAFSEGEARGAYGSPDYTIDVLNAVAALKKFPEADPNRIGMWGHSMGGWITLRAMVVDPDIKAGVIWAGVVGSYEDLMTKWRRSNTGPTPTPFSGSRRWRQDLTAMYGTPEDNPDFWRTLSANYFLDDLSGPIQLHHGTADEDVPLEFSQILYDQLIQAGQTGELYVYPEDNHNLSNYFTTAMNRSIDFFDIYVKGN